MTAKHWNHVALKDSTGRYHLVRAGMTACGQDAPCGPAIRFDVAAEAVSPMERCETCTPWPMYEPLQWSVRRLL